MRIPVFDGGPVQDARYHYQGIAPANINEQPPANGVICASSTVAYFSIFAQAGGGAIRSGVVSVTQPESEYFHAGGIQRLGPLLPLPLETTKKDSQGNVKKGIVTFYNLSTPANSFLYKFKTPSKKASATAITTYTQSGKEYALLFVYQYDDFQMYIYRADADAVAGTTSPWTLMRTYTGNAFNASGVVNKQYQNFALVTQQNTTGDVVYLIGFRQDEVVVLWSINLTSTPGTENGQTIETTFGEPTLVTSIDGWVGTDWANGVGLQILSPTQLRIYATDADPTGTVTDYRFNVYVYG